MALLITQQNAEIIVLQEAIKTIIVHDAYALIEIDLLLKAP